MNNLRQYPRRIDWLLAVLITLVGLALRVYNLGEYSLWLDESHTWFFAHMAWSDFWEALRATGVHPPFYFFLEKLVVGVLGENEVGMRLLSVGADALSMLLAMFLGWQVAGRLGALVSGWFWAFNPITIWYAQDARPYAMAAMLALAVLTIYIRSSRRFSLLSELLAGLLISVGLLTHYFFFLVVGGLILLTLPRIHNYPNFFRGWVFISILAMIPLSAWLYWFFQLPDPSLGIGWIQVPAIQDIPWTIWNLLTGYGGKLSLASSSFGLLTGCFLVLGIISGKKQRSKAFFTAGILLPLILVWILSLRRPVYIDRYFILLLPFLLIGIAVGAREVWQRAAGITSTRLASGMALMLLAGVGLLSAWQVHADPKYAREDWKGLSGFILQSPLKDAPYWLSHPEMLVPFKYYFHEGNQLVESVIPPTCATPCWWVLRQPYTPTHAFTQSIGDPDRPWKPEIPLGCQVLEQWDTATGLAAWLITCQPTSQ
jgi:mannosyltransferase